MPDTRRDTVKEWADRADEYLARARGHVPSFFNALTGVLTWTTVIGVGLLAWGADRAAALDSGGRQVTVMGSVLLGLSFVFALIAGYRTVVAWQRLQSLCSDLAGFAKSKSVFDDLSASDRTRERAARQAEKHAVALDDWRGTGRESLRRLLALHMLLLLAGLLVLVWAQLGYAAAPSAVLCSPLLP